MHSNYDLAFKVYVNPKTMSNKLIDDLILTVSNIYFASGMAPYGVHICRIPQAKYTETDKKACKIGAIPIAIRPWNNGDTLEVDVDKCF